MPYSDPEKSRDYQREYKRMQRAGECQTPGQTPGQTRLPAEFRLKTARDVLDLLDEQVDAVRNETEVGTLERARCIAYLAGVALKAIEAGDVATRVEAIESVLKQRKSSSNGRR